MRALISSKKPFVEAHRSSITQLRWAIHYPDSAPLYVAPHGGDRQVMPRTQHYSWRPATQVLPLRFRQSPGWDQHQGANSALPRQPLLAMRRGL